MMNIFGARELSKFPAPTCWLTKACTSRSRGSNTLSGLHRHLHAGGAHTCTQVHTHTRKRKNKQTNLCYVSVKKKETTCNMATSTLLNKR